MIIKLRKDGTWKYPIADIKIDSCTVYNHKTDKYTGPFYPSGKPMKKLKVTKKPRKSLAKEIVDLDKTIKRSPRKATHPNTKIMIDARNMANMSVKEVAKAMKVAPERVYNIEGSRSAPTFKAMEQYAKAVGCKVRIELTPVKNGKGNG